MTTTTTFRRDDLPKRGSAQQARADMIRNLHAASGQSAPGVAFRTDAALPKSGGAAAAREAMINDLVRSR
jgi:hypothetical protein